MTKDTKPLNVENLMSDFAAAGFTIREFERNDGMLRVDWNPANDTIALAMRTAMAKNGADVSTQYKYIPMDSERGTLAQRDRAIVPFATDGDLRDFFKSVVRDYGEITGPDGLPFETVGEAPRGKLPGQSSQPSSYSVQTRKRTLRG